MKPVTISLFCALALCAQAAEGKFVNLFDGKSLAGWTQKGGEAKYSVEKGTITGRAVAGIPNSFLCTKKDYGDFILEYEYKCDSRLNSGVQIRSNAYDREVTKTLENGKTKKFPAGRVHGYQVEIDPNKPSRMWSAGIYDEGRRGWLFPGLRGGDKEKFTKQGQRLYKTQDWNKIRVETRGDHIRTWLNGELRADFRDGLTAKGFIGLQVHGIGQKRELVGATIRWRNIRIRELK